MCIILIVALTTTFYGGHEMKTDHRSIGKYISILYRQAQCYIANEMKPYNIGSGQYIFLSVLYEYDGLSQEELSNKLMMDKGTTARAIDKLENAGYVTRKKNPEDRRIYNVFITDKARDIKPIFYRILSSWTDILGKDLSQEERVILYKILEKMVNSTMLYTKED